jgi:hypothetical protein
MIFRTGNIDFCLFNPLNNNTYTNDKLLIKEGTIPENTFWNNIKSITWSCGCYIFCVVNDEFIIVGDTRDNEILICNKTVEIFNLLANATHRK